MLERMHAVKTRPFYYEVNIRVETNARQILCKNIFHTLPPTEKDVFRIVIKSLLSLLALLFTTRNQDNNNLLLKARKILSACYHLNLLH